MSMDIGKVISQAIIEKKLVKITYENKNETITNFIIGVKYINFKKRILYVVLMNKHDSVKDKKGDFIYFDKIRSAWILDLTTYDQPPDLIEQLQKHKEDCLWLGYDFYSHNVLNYYRECNILNGDPARSDYQNVLGIDAKVLAENNGLQLTEEQNKHIFENVLDEYSRQRGLKIFTLVLNRLSISRNDGKIYVIAYNVITYNPITKQLLLDKKISFNLTFIYFKDTKKSLEEFVDGDLEDWMDEYKKDPYKAIEKMHLKTNEKADTKPYIMMLEQKTFDYINSYYSHIANLFETNQLNKPLKAFFGRYTANDNKPKTNEPYIISIDEKLNKTQLRVIYNSLKYPITYVQGPPGTGKTQTILNVVISSFLLNNTTLVCSNNNQAVDSVLAKFKIVYNEQNIPIPFLRLGNLTFNEQAIEKIIQLYNYNIDDLNIVLRNSANITKTPYRLKNMDVLKILESDEHYEYLNRCIIEYKQLIDNNQEFESYVDKILKRLKVFEEAKTKCKPLNFNELEKEILTISRNEDLTKYFYYYCLSEIQKLKSIEYKELIKICLSEDKNSRVIEFNKYINNPNNMKLLSKVFPIIFTTNISAHRLGGPEFAFDLVIIDEAGQCDLPTSLIPISKAKSLLLVGDVKQLKPVITISLETDKKLIKEFNIKDSDKYSFYFNSIYSTMTKADKLSNRFMLDYHYRCRKTIIDFSNQRYYGSHLKILSENEDSNVKDPLEIHVVDNQVRDLKNSCINEAVAIVNYIQRNNVEDCQIVTPFHNQADLINNMLRERKLIDKVKAGTIHSLQGAEKDTIIFSPAISEYTSQKTYEWLKNNKEIINVGVTRAKKKFVVFADTKAIKNKARGIEDDLSLLIDYVTRKGKLIIPSINDFDVVYGKSNHSINEDQFFKTIALYCNAHKSYVVKRNVSVKELVSNKFYVDKDYEYDFVIYKKNLLFGPKPHLIIELNGGEHLGTVTIERNDREKREIAKKLGINIAVLPNSYSKRYDCIDLLLGNNKLIQNKISAIVKK